MWLGVVGLLGKHEHGEESLINALGVSLGRIQLIKCFFKLFGMLSSGKNRGVSEGVGWGEWHGLGFLSYLLGACCPLGSLVLLQVDSNRQPLS